MKKVLLIGQFIAQQWRHDFEESQIKSASKKKAPIMNRRSLKSELSELQS
jgi:hypothetical protein